MDKILFSSRIDKRTLKFFVFFFLVDKRILKLFIFSKISRVLCWIIWGFSKWNYIVFYYNTICIGFIYLRLFWSVDFYSNVIFPGNYPLLAGVLEYLSRSRCKSNICWNYMLLKFRINDTFQTIIIAWSSL